MTSRPIAQPPPRPVPMVQPGSRASTLNPSLPTFLPTRPGTTTYGASTGPKAFPDGRTSVQSHRTISERDQDVLLSKIRTPSPADDPFTTLFNRLTSSTLSSPSAQDKDPLTSTHGATSMPDLIVAHARALASGHAKPATDAGFYPPPCPTSTSPDNKTVFVGALPQCMSPEELRVIFEPFGEVETANCPPGRGCGFVTFLRRDSAEAAIERMQGFPVYGSRLRPSWGHSQRDRGGVRTACAAPSAVFQDLHFLADFLELDTKQRQRMQIFNHFSASGDVGHLKALWESTPSACDTRMAAYPEATSRASGAYDEPIGRPTQHKSSQRGSARVPTAAHQAISHCPDPLAESYESYGSLVDRVDALTSDTPALELSPSRSSWSTSSSTRGSWSDELSFVPPAWADDAMRLFSPLATVVAEKAEKGFQAGLGWTDGPVGTITAGLEGQAAFRPSRPAGLLMSAVVRPWVDAPQLGKA